MIVKNEEEVLARCLDSAAGVADEIIILDTGSQDRTKEIALRYTQGVYDFAWVDDFAAARNASFEKATKDYILWLDADDVLEQLDREALLALKQTLSGNPDLVMMKYHVAFDMEGNPTFSYYRERLLRREAGFRWEGEVHEVITPRGEILHSDIAVCHKKTKPAAPGRNLKIYQSLIRKGKALEPRQQFYYARELYYNGCYEEAAAQFLAFLEEGKGWVENNISACRDLANCYTRLNRPGDTLPALFRSFVYDVPRAEVCCEIGARFLEQGQFQTAVFWYQTAAQCTPDETNGGFCEPDCYGFLPYIQLCVCFDRLGDAKQAAHYNDLAGALKPEDPSFLSNKAYFDKNK